MKPFKQLALVSAIAALPMTGVAMQQLDDEVLSGVTGQDGISITLDTAQITSAIWLEDTTGFTGYDEGGFIVLGSYDSGSDTWSGLTMDLSGTTIEIDAASNSSGAGTGVLNVGISTANPLTLSNLSIGVQGNGEEVTGTGIAADIGRVGSLADTTEVLSIGTLSIDALDLSLQLGPEAGTSAPGASPFLTIGSGSLNISLVDVQLFGGQTNTGWVGVDEISISGLDLAGTTGNLVAGGLQLTMGNDATGIDITLSRVSLGDAAAPSLGNVYLTDLSLAGTQLTIAGK